MSKRNPHYSIIRRSVKYPRIEFKTGNMVVILPKGLNSEQEVLQKNMRWITKKEKEILKSQTEIRRKIGKNNITIFGKRFKPKESKNFNFQFNNGILEFDKNDKQHILEIKKVLKERLDNKLKDAAKEYQRTLKVKVGKISIRNQKTKWGSCSKDGDLNFNLKLAFLPNKLINYVVFHEILHMKVRNHKTEFWKLVENEFKDYVNLEKQLQQYWFFLFRYNKISL